MFYFTPLQGFFFTFPSRYYFAIGHPRVFSLTRWSSLIHTGFHVSHATRDEQFFKGFRLLDFHHLWCRIQLLRLAVFFFDLFKVCFSWSDFDQTDFSLNFVQKRCSPTTPVFTGLGCSPVARRYWGNRVCFLFLWLLRCFSSPGCLFPIYEFNR